jgi:hypothetical protein
MPIFSEIDEGRADKKYNSPEIDDICLQRTEIEAFFSKFI